MKLFKIIILFIIIILTTGCWNYRELSEISIAGAIGIDYAGEEFDVSVEIINARKVANSASAASTTSNEAPLTIYHTKGKTIKEAINNMVFETPFPIYIGHLNLLVIGEDAAKKGINEFIDYLMADTESRKLFPTVVVKNDKAINAMKILMPLDTITSSNMRDSLENISVTNSMVSNRVFDEIIMCLYMEGRNTTISAVEIVGNQDVGKNTDNLAFSIPPASLKLKGSAVFKDDKLIGYYDNIESRAYTIIRNKAQTVSLSFPCDKNNNYGNVTIEDVKNKLNIKLVKNKPIVEINVTGNATLPEFDCEANITTSTGLKKVEKMINDELEKEIKETIKKTQEYDSDVFGFGEQLYKNEYKYWDKNKKNWDKIFQSLKYKVKSNIKIVNVGSTVKSAKDKDNGNGKDE